IIRSPFENNQLLALRGWREIGFSEVAIRVLTVMIVRQVSQVQSHQVLNSQLEEGSDASSCKCVTEERDGSVPTFAFMIAVLVVAQPKTDGANGGIGCGSQRSPKQTFLKSSDR